MMINLLGVYVVVKNIVLNSICVIFINLLDIFVVFCIFVCWIVNIYIRLLIYYNKKCEVKE